MSEIKKAFNNLKLTNKPELLCEPGRSLVAESGSSIVKVVLGKNKKYILMMELMEVYLMQVF